MMNCRLHAIVNRQMLDTIEALAIAVDAKDPYTHDHSKRVSEICVATLEALGIGDPKACREMRLAGILHDIGKIGVQEAILGKKGSLTAEEFTIIKRHPTVGARIVGGVKGLERVTKAILHHHERHDGLGYPAGLSARDIPIMAKVITVADVFDCLTSDRPYRKAKSHDAAMAELRRCKGTQFDPDVVDAFLATMKR
jgi:putative nucleotidyltransferase with HDIG domain